MCQKFHDCYETDPEFLNRVITGDETWIFEYNSETKRQSVWDAKESPHPAASKYEQIANHLHCVL